MINPYFDEPEDIMIYKVDNVKKEVTIYVKNTVKNSKKIQKAIVNDYGLNRIELRQLRFEWYDLYYTHKLILNENSVSKQLIDRAKQKIDELKKDNEPFSGMIRYFEKQN